MVTEPSSMSIKVSFDTGQFTKRLVSLMRQVIVRSGSYVPSQAKLELKVLLEENRINANTSSRNENV